MRLAFAGFLALHGLIHLIGVARAAGVAGLPPGDPVSRLAGLGWLLASLALLTAAAAVAVGRAEWWMAATVGLVLSQALAFSAWHEARYATVANLIILVPLGLRWLEARPSSLPSLYTRAVVAALHTPPTLRTVTEADLESLPPLVQAYLRRVGVVGKPRPATMRMRFQGTFRQGPDSPWMTVTGEQHNVFDPFARLFLMRASMYGVPFTALHVYADGASRMRGRAAALVNVLDVTGPEMLQGETVTVFNDLCVLAPGALIGAPVVWRPGDEHSVVATFTSAGQTITATLRFDAHGDLADFVSDDRYQADGRTSRLVRWSTPVGAYRDFAGYRLPSVGEARWHEEGGEYAYAQFTMEDIAYNVSGSP